MDLERIVASKDVKAKHKVITLSVGYLMRSNTGEVNATEPA